MFGGLEWWRIVGLIILVGVFSLPLSEETLFDWLAAQFAKIRYLFENDRVFERFEDLFRYDLPFF